MNILIKGMAMPKNCVDCPLFESKYHFHGCHAVPKSFNDMDMWNFVGDRPSWCPLVELPPHGDLVDKRMLINNISNNAFANANVDSKEEYEFWNRVWEYIRSAPTVVESEE